LICQFKEWFDSVLLFNKFNSESQILHGQIFFIDVMRTYIVVQYVHCRITPPTLE